MTVSPTISNPIKDKPSTTLEYILLTICLSALALRITYTEAPTAHALSLPFNIIDSIYSLTMSGLLIFSFVLWLAWNLRRPKFTYRVTGIEIGLLLFCIASVISAFGASDKRLALTTIFTLTAPIFAALLLVQILDSPTKVKLVLAVIIALGITSAYQSAEQFFLTNQMTIEQYQEAPKTVLEPLGIEPGTLQHFLFEHRLYAKTIRGFFTTSNSLGSFLLMALFAAIALVIYSRPFRKPKNITTRYTLVPALAATAIAIVLVMTRSKGAILSVLFASVLFVITLRFGTWLRANKKILLFICISLVVVGSCLIAWFGHKHDRLPGGNSMLVRWQYWYASAKMLTDHPITGVGPGNFPLFYPHYKPDPAPESVADPHNFPLSLLTQFGPLGMLGFLLMLLIPLYKILSHDTQTSPDDSNHTGKTLTTILLLTISAVLLLIRPLLVRTQLTGGFGLITYTILTLYLSTAAAFIIAFWLLTIPLAAQYTKYEIRNTTTVEAALLCALLGVLLHNLIDFAIFEPGVLTTFWTLMACLITLDVTRTNPPQYTCTPAPSTRILAPVAALIVLALYIAHIWWPVYNSTVRIHHAQQAASVGRFDQAHALLDAAAKDDSLSAAALSFNARLYVRQYRESQQSALLENAKTFFDIAIQRSPADYKNYEKLSDVYSLLGRSEQAYEWGLKATQLYPGCDRLWFNLAKIAEQLNKPALALQHYKKAVEIEDAYRNQFKIMYPQIGETVSRLGEQNYKLAKQRIKELESLEL